ncbi:Tyrosinase [Entomophthora muscae]|uniref:Tyrosinase n=1 Tax=Entomophthora muscae TaxID=34485 RepID=A0ACC2UGZ0_9FUNG|nr:Tyrosinase [Entomophthora muscae]
MQFSIIVFLLGVSGQLCNRNSARVRKNVLSLSANEWGRYVNAVRQLNSGARPTLWDMYANYHVQYFDSVHWSPWFLVWHRLYLHSVERALQTIDPGVTIPYWDWTQYAQNPQLDPVLSNRMFGGSGDVRSGCVSGGYFRDFTAYFWGNGASSTHCLIRSYNIFQRPFTSATVIDRNYLNEPTIASFAQAIEGVPHSTAHNNIGGEFSGHASPGDPLFYSHHAFVDKLWFDWQNRHPNQFYDYPLSTNLNVPPLEHEDI